MAAALLSSATSYFAAVARERLHPGTVEFWVPIAPAAIYWLVAAFFDVLDMLQLPATERYRLHSQALADKRNQLTKGQVVCRVLLQHAIQVLTGWALVFADPGYCDGVRAPPGGQGLLRAAGSWLAAMLVFDSWQYAIHRFMHENKTLYNAIHSVHHRLLVCYAYGALYNHPLEAFLLDTVGSVVTAAVSRLSCEQALWFFTFSSVKTVLDHSGYRWPVNLLHPFFPNNARYHDAHHDLRGFRKNYSQPFFTHWDWMLGTYMDPAELEAKDEAKARAAGAAAAGKAKAS